MELLLGSHVLERGHRVGRLAGFELEPAELRIRRLIISHDGDLGPQAVTRPLSAVASATRRTIELGEAREATALPPVADVVLLSRATRFSVGGNGHGRFAGADVDLATRRVLSLTGRQHWWSRRVTLTASNFDCSNPGEVRARRTGDTRAA